jgi:hypothetical protein
MQEKQNQEYGEAKQQNQNSGGRKILYAVLAFVGLAIAFGIIAFTVTFLLTARRTADIVQPIGDLVSRLTVQSTPVILPDPVTIVRELNDVARLETAEYIAEKVIRAERDQDFLFGAFGETLLFVAYGEVIAGIDLGMMTAADVQVVDPVTVMINLPEAEILHATIDNDRSYVADRDTGLAIAITGGIDENLETEVRQRAEAEIEMAALEAGILERANENAELFMTSFLMGLGFENIIFTDGPPPPAPPYEQPLPKGHTLITPTPEG